MQLTVGLDTMNSIAFTDVCRQRWTSFFTANIDRLFQTALLLSADRVVAENSLAASLENTDFSQAPAHETLDSLQRAVVTKSILGGCAISSAIDKSPFEILQRGLWPVLQMEGLPRTCFVLHTLLGYAISSCAQMLKIQTNDVRASLRIAILQLQQASLAESVSQQPLIEHSSWHYNHRPTSTSPDGVEQQTSKLPVAGGCSGSGS
jgi:hypothetical protein